MQIICIKDLTSRAKYGIILIEVEIMCTVCDIFDFIICPEDVEDDDWSLKSVCSSERRVLGLELRGRRFESYRADQYKGL